VTAGFRSTVILTAALATLSVCSSDEPSGGSGSGGSGGTAMGTGGSSGGRGGTGGTGTSTTGGTSGGGGSSDNGGTSGSGGSSGEGGSSGSGAPPPDAAYAGVEASGPRASGREIARLVAGLTGGTSGRWTGARTESLYEALDAEQGWGLYVRLFQLIDGDRPDWPRLDSPASLARDYAVAYLSLAAGYNLAVRFNDAGVAADPVVVRAIINARSQLVEAGPGAPGWGQFRWGNYPAAAPARYTER
jgi:hypothetical protein